MGKLWRLPSNTSIQYSRRRVCQTKHKKHLFMDFRDSDWILYKDTNLIVSSRVGPCWSKPARQVTQHCACSFKAALYSSDQPQSCLMVPRPTDWVLYLVPWLKSSSALCLSQAAYIGYGHPWLVTGTLRKPRNPLGLSVLSILPRYCSQLSFNSWT